MLALGAVGFAASVGTGAFGGLIAATTSTETTTVATARHRWPRCRTSPLRYLLELDRRLESGRAAWTGRTQQRRSRQQWPRRAGHRVGSPAAELGRTIDSVPMADMP